MNQLFCAYKLSKSFFSMWNAYAIGILEKIAAYLKLQLYFSSSDTTIWHRVHGNFQNLKVEFQPPFDFLKYAHLYYALIYSNFSSFLREDFFYLAFKKYLWKENTLSGTCSKVGFGLTSFWFLSVAFLLLFSSELKNYHRSTRHLSIKIKSLKANVLLFLCIDPQVI